MTVSEKKQLLENIEALSTRFCTPTFGGTITDIDTVKKIIDDMPITKKPVEEKIMRCSYCNNNMRKTKGRITFRSKNLDYTFFDVEMYVCDCCGDKVVEDDVFHKLEKEFSEILGRIKKEQPEKETKGEEKWKVNFLNKFMEVK